MLKSGEMKSGRGYWTNLYLGGFFAVILLVGSFFIKRFWCIICPMGYLMGLFKRFNLFKLKKDCTSCTECGACYHVCPMRIKSIYTEREKEHVQTVDCMMCGECIHKCPEDHALSMTFCGKVIYSSSRQTVMSKFSGEKLSAKDTDKSSNMKKTGGFENEYKITENCIRGLVLGCRSSRRGSGIWKPFI